MQLEIIASNGYKPEAHWVLTEDGYKLAVHRVANPGRKAVLLQHGLLSSSADWVVMGKGHSLGEDHQCFRVTNSDLFSNACNSWRKLPELQGRLDSSTYCIVGNNHLYIFNRKKKIFRSVFEKYTLSFSKF